MRFLDSWTDQYGDRTSTVLVEEGNRSYCGKARCHPEDDFSEFTGCRYAQERAEIKALKGKLKRKRAACDECRKFVRAVTQYKNFDPKSPSARAMFRQLNRRIKEVNDIIDEINFRTEALKKSIAMQDTINEKFKQKRLKELTEN